MIEKILWSLLVCYPSKDYPFLLDQGLWDYGPGTKISIAAQEILHLLIQSHK